MIRRFSRSPLRATLVGAALLLAVPAFAGGAATPTTTPAVRPAPAAGSAPARVNERATDLDTVVALLLDLAAGDLKAVRQKRGWMIQGVAKGSTAAGLGLVEGDVIVSADGLPRANAAAWRGAYEAFRKSGQVVVAIERGGQPLTITFTMAVTPEPAPLAHDFGGEVRKLDDRTFEIPRAVVDRVLGDPTLAAGGARVVPSIKDGNPNGFKLYAVRAGSLWQALGLENGDTVTEIGGIAVTSPERALEAYTRAKAAETVTVKLVRRGVERVHTYRIVR